MVDRRVLQVIQADVVKPDGDQGFVISAFLLGGLLVQVKNQQNRFITSTVVPAQQADALAAAIEQIEQTPDWELGRAMNGDPSGAGLIEFCDWLRQGAFEIVSGQQNVAERT